MQYIINIARQYAGLYLLYIYSQQDILLSIHCLILVSDFKIGGYCKKIFSGTGTVEMLNDLFVSCIVVPVKWIIYIFVLF